MSDEEDFHQESSGIDESLDEAVTKFLDAEEALRNFYVAAEDLRSVQESLHISHQALQDTYENATENLGKAENSIRDGASSLRDLSDELKGIARELVAASSLIRKFEPERLYREVGEFKTLHKELTKKIRNWTISCSIVFIAVIVLVVAIFVVF